MYDIIRTMDNTPQSPLVELLQQPRVRAVLYVAMVCMVALATFLVVLTVNGYGTLQLTGAPTNATVSINGHNATTTSLSLRPGSYQVVVTSPTLESSAGTVSVPLWGKATYTPKLQARSANSIARSLLGAEPRTAIAPAFDSSQWFQNDTWLAGTLAPTRTVLVAHYDSEQKKWVLVFCNADGYPDDTSTLPADIAAYIAPSLTGVS